MFKFLHLISNPGPVEVVLGVSQIARCSLSCTNRIQTGRSLRNMLQLFLNEFETSSRDLLYIGSVAVQAGSKVILLHESHALLFDKY